MGEQVYAEQVTVQARAEDVWLVLADVERWPQWTESMEAVSLLDGELRTGAHARVKQPRLPVGEWTVDQVVPGRSFLWSSTSRGVRTVADHVVEPSGDGTRVTLVLRQSGPLAGLARLLFGGMIRRNVQLEAQGLKREVERNTA